MQQQGDFVGRDVSDCLENTGLEAASNPSLAHTFDTFHVAGANFPFVPHRETASSLSQLDRLMGAGGPLSVRSADMLSEIYGDLNMLNEGPSHDQAAHPMY